MHCGTLELSLRMSKSIYILCDSAVSWASLYEWASAEIKNTGHLLEMRKRENPLCKLKLAAPFDDLTVIALNEYRQSFGLQRVPSTHGLAEYARQRQHSELELEMLRHCGQIRHLRNQEIARVYDLSATSFNHDLAWRSATILQQRRVLPKKSSMFGRFLASNASCILCVSQARRGENLFDGLR